jgi:hypothetical protein
MSQPEKAIAWGQFQRWLISSFSGCAAATISARSSNSDDIRSPPTRARMRRCAASHAGWAFARRASPARAIDQYRSRRSAPGRERIHPLSSSGGSVRVSVVLSIASNSPSSPCVSSPDNDSACRRVSCVIRKPESRSASSYNCVTAREARRRFAHAQGRTGSNSGRGCVIGCPAAAPAGGRWQRGTRRAAAQGRLAQGQAANV